MESILIVYQFTVLKELTKLPYFSESVMVQCAAYSMLPKKLLKKGRN
jgi:hypothetical protein